MVPGWFSRLALTMFLVMGGLVATQVLATASPPAGTPGGPPTGLKPGDTLRDAQGEPALVVPARGQEAGAEVVYADGTSNELLVSTHPDGEVEVIEWGEDSGGDGSQIGDGGGGSGTAECSDNASSQHPWAVAGTYQWYYNQDGEPTDVSGFALQGFRNAIINITHEVNNCGRADTVSASSNFLMTTSVKPKISWNGSSVSCNGGYNDVAGWLKMGFSYLGYSCWDGNGASDNVLNPNYGWYVPGLTSCSNDWSVEGVMTHEWGHAFGLGHVTPESSHGKLTMSPDNNGTCQNSEATLGLGDMLGLEAKY